MDPRFTSAGVSSSSSSSSSSDLLPITINPFFPPNNNTLAHLHEGGGVEDRSLTYFRHDDYTTSTSSTSSTSSSSSSSSSSPSPRFGQLLGSFPFPFPFPFQNNNDVNKVAYGSSSQFDLDYNLTIHQHLPKPPPSSSSSSSSVKHQQQQHHHHHHHHMFAAGLTHFLSTKDPPSSLHYHFIPPPPPPTLRDADADAFHNPPSLSQIPPPSPPPPLTDIRFRRLIPLYTHQYPLPHHGPTTPTTFTELSTQPQPPVATSTSNVSVPMAMAPEDDDIDFSDAILNYIDQILMEEDMEDRVYMLQESLDLQAQQQSLYEALGKTQPPNAHHLQPDNHSLSAAPCTTTIHANGGSNGTGCIKSPAWINASDDHDAPFTVRRPPNSNPDGFLGSTVAPLPTPDDSTSVSNFRKGVEEASKFLPADNQILNFTADAIFFPQDEAKQGVFKMEKNNGGDSSSIRLRGRKNPYYNGDVDPEEERSIKQAAIYTEPILRSEQFDIVLLHSMGKGAAALGAYRETLQAEKSRTLQRNRQQNGSSGRKGRGKRQNGKKKEVVDLRTLLVRCAQAAAADDHRAASELLKTIKQSSSPFGDGNQRLAHCFADGLEARIGGTGSQIYKALVNKKTLAVDFLKAYHLYLASCPFRKISIFCANKTILIRAKDAMRVHIIDFGILYGFQWPTLIQHFAGREGGPPKLKITGIEFPQSGFRPAEQVEETGRRLAEYAKMFGVPFEYNAIAKRWDTIKAEDIKVEEGELVVVNCMYRFKNILDETASLESSRSIVLNTVKEIKPDIFVHGVVNGAYNAPFFVTRFREALFHFSSLFDMLEATVPREIPERMLIEKEIFGREALNVIACEGWERVERPETYKQWQVRNVKAGFNQIPFDRDFMAKATRKVSTHYHKDFVIDEDGKWLLLGWKGRTIYAMSCWHPL